jgi:hypothetical protein
VAGDDQDRVQAGGLITEIQFGFASVDESPRANRTFGWNHTLVGDCLWTNINFGEGGGYPGDDAPGVVSAGIHPG